MKIHNTLILLAFLSFAATYPNNAAAADANTALLRGHVSQVREYVSSGGTFRVEVQLITDSPSGGPWSPFFDCSPFIWSDCEVSDLITGCTTITTSQEVGKEFKLLIHHCPTFNPNAGVCLEATLFHNGFTFIADAVSMLANSNCTTF